MGWTRRMLAAGAALALLVPANAVAKEITSAKVCGASECSKLDDPQAAMALAGGGPPTDGPKRALPWYRSTLTIRAEDDEEVFTDRFSVTVVPSAGVMRGDDHTWMAMPAETERAYAKLTAALAPRPARTLPGVGVDAELPAARVDEVVEPPSTAAPAPAADGSNGWIVALAGGLLAALAVGLTLLVRRRRGSGRLPAPEAPGAA